MKSRSYVSLGLGIVCLVMLSAGFYLMFFPPLTTVSQQKKSSSDISLPTPIPAQSTRQAIFSAEAGDYIGFFVFPETGFPPMPIWGYSVTVNVYFGSQLLYSNTAYRIDGTVNLSQTATYTFQIVNDNDFEVVFLSTGADASYLWLHHPYLEYSQVPNNSLQSVSLMLIMGSIIVGVASLLIVAVQPKRTHQTQ